MRGACTLRLRSLLSRRRERVGPAPRPPRLPRAAAARHDIALSAPPTAAAAAAAAPPPLPPLSDSDDCERYLTALGVDPDVRGALALLRWAPRSAPDGPPTVQAAVFDTPFMMARSRRSLSRLLRAARSCATRPPARQVSVGARDKARLRARHDPPAMRALLLSLPLPPGSPAALERPHARAGMGSSAGFASGVGLGLWWALLLSSNAAVALILPRNWKAPLNLVGPTVGKDQSRALAAAMFPAAAASLARKRDHGRAEALLLASRAAVEGRPEGCALRAAVAARCAAGMQRVAAPGGCGEVLAAAAAANAAAKREAREATRRAALDGAGGASPRVRAPKAASPRRATRAAGAIEGSAGASASLADEGSSRAAVFGVDDASLTVVALREALRARGLRVGGCKAELRARLEVAWAGAAAAVAA